LGLLPGRISASDFGLQVCATVRWYQAGDKGPGLEVTKRVFAKGLMKPMAQVTSTHSRTR